MPVRHWTTSYRKGDCAQDIVNRVLRCKIADNNKGRERQYIAREFSIKKSVTDEGQNVDSKFYTFPNKWVTVAAKVYKVSSGQEPLLKCSSYIGLCRGIELILGIPFLIIPSIDLRKLRRRPIAEIQKRLLKVNGCAKRELKEIKTLYQKATTTLNPRTLGAKEILLWLMGDNSTGISVDNIYIKLIDMIVERERDRLFYIRMHPKQFMIHKCHNEKLLEKIKIVEWVLYTNPLRDSEFYGIAFF